MPESMSRKKSVKSQSKKSKKRSEGKKNLKQQRTKSTIESNDDASIESDELQEQAQSVKRTADSSANLTYEHLLEYKFRCPLCGRTFTSAVLRNLHLLLYPRVRYSCNLFPDEKVECVLCTKRIRAKYFDIHPCILELVEGLEQMAIKDDHVTLTTPDFCYICSKRQGCKYTLFSHLLVFHFPFAEDGQCGFCGKKAKYQLEKHVETHRMQILQFSENRMRQLFQSSLAVGKKKTPTSNFLNYCCEQSQVEKDKPTDFLLYFVMPTSCLTCVNFMGNLYDLHYHILWDSLETSHRALRSTPKQMFMIQPDRYMCRYCKSQQILMNSHSCVCFDNVMSTGEAPQFRYSVHTSCLLCWNKFSSPAHLLLHVPMMHNFGDVTKCGLCFVRLDEMHVKSHTVIQADANAAPRQSHAKSQDIQSPPSSVPELNSAEGQPEDENKYFS